MVLTGILFVLRSGIPWEMLPKETGCGSGMVVRRRLKYWQRRGVWRRLHQVLLSELRRADRLDDEPEPPEATVHDIIIRTVMLDPNPTQLAELHSGDQRTIQSAGADCIPLRGCASPRRPGEPAGVQVSASGSRLVQERAGDGAGT